MTTAAFTAVAHRGDPYVHRENTLPSIRSALRAGAGAVEIDVRLTRDGVPVLLHDATLGRLWHRERALASLTAAEVRALTGGGVPTLAEALAEITVRDRTCPTPRRRARRWPRSAPTARRTGCTTAAARPPCSPCAGPTRTPRSR